ncbi:MAG TPA: NAD(P)-binding oxidoreductase [Flavobacteriales bacterium]|nr:NAD(P)-binding oxidoreductase [Flavobacteriales bacterium]
MKLAILGATGRTGKWVLQTALKNGHTVHALVRNKTKLENYQGNLTVFEGVPSDNDLLAKAITGCDALISTLNISRTSDFPWAKLRTPPTLMSDTVKKIIDTGLVKRVVVCSAWGTHETKKDIPAWFRFMINNSKIGLGYADHERQETLLKNSNLDWTIVRPVGLINSEKEKEIRVILDKTQKPRLTISRKNVAKFMVEAVEKNVYIKQTPVISYK